MIKLKALGGVLLGCVIMVFIGILFYKLGSISQFTGIVGTIMALFLANGFSKHKAPIFAILVAIPLCLGTAYTLSVYLPANSLTKFFANNLEYNQEYRVEFLAEYNADPQFGLDYKDDPDLYYAEMYEDWLFLTEDLDGNLEEFNAWYDEEWIKPNEDRQQLSYWYAHPEQLIDKNDYYIAETGAPEDFRNLLAANMLGAFASIPIYIVYAVKRR